MTASNNQGDPSGYVGTNVNIRTGPSTSCKALAEGQPGDAVYAHCYYVPVAGQYWTYLTDYTKGVEGWSVSQYVVSQSPLVEYC